MKTYYVYIVCCSDGKYYTGVTNNLERRIAEHIEGRNPNSYTFIRRPVRLVWSADFNCIANAIEAEKKIKGWSRKKKQALIQGDYDALKRLSKKKFH